LTSDDLSKLAPEFYGGYDNIKWNLRRESYYYKLTDENRNYDFVPGEIIMLSSLLGRLIHLPGLRGNPARSYPNAAVSDVFPGTFQDYVASIVAKWQQEKSNENLESLNVALEKIGLTWKVTAKSLDATRIELRVGRLPHFKNKKQQLNDTVNIADVGVGVSQALPVAVALVEAKPGQMVYIEQPEIHLHPKAQKQMAQLLAGAAKRGVIVIAETHSTLLLRGIQTLVASGEISPDLVKLHWFKRDHETGETTVTSADLDENGAYGPDWPEDFDDIMLDTEQEYLDAVENRMAKK